MLGRERGFLTPDDLMTVLEGVELRPELIAAVIGRVTAEGIEWREDIAPDIDLVHSVDIDIDLGIEATGARANGIEADGAGPARPPSSGKALV